MSVEALSRVAVPDGLAVAPELPDVLPPVKLRRGFLGLMRRHPTVTFGGGLVLILILMALLAPWIAQSSDYLRSLDPYHHLITHEGSPVNDTAVWTQDTLDFTQDHRYNMSNLLLSFHTTASQWLGAYPTKPFLVGEFGNPLNIDNLGLFVHNGLWSAPMNGANANTDAVRPAPNARCASR